MNPSLACGNFLNLKQDIDDLMSVGTKMLHIDVMDGHYVPNLCFSLNVVRAVSACCDATIEVHLMTDRPEDYVERMRDAGANMLSFHLDATRFPVGLLKRIKAAGMRAGIVLNPNTDHDDAAPLLEYVDYVNVMGVEPGFSNQTMLVNHTRRHLSFVQSERDKNRYAYQIMVDGGVTFENAKMCLAEGADILVAGGLTIYGQKDSLKECAKRFLLLQP